MAVVAYRVLGWKNRLGERDGQEVETVVRYAVVNDECVYIHMDADDAKSTCLAAIRAGPQRRCAD